MPTATHGTANPSKSVPRTRLDSWKEIADYLSKGERTAKRWETERSLPVHHVPGGGHGSVYAFTAELDEWLLSQTRQERASPRDTDTAKSETDPSNQHRTQSLLEKLEVLDLTKLATRPVRFRRIVSYAALTLATVFVVTYFFNESSNRAYRSYLRPLLNATHPTTSFSDSDSERQLAHELYLRGRFEWDRRTPESLNRALDLFTQAIVHDPGNAQAYVGLADTYNLLREYTMMPESDAYERAIAAAKKAIQLDDSLAEAHRSLAFDEFWGNWDFEAAEKEFQRAIELNPRDPTARLWFANAFGSPGWYPLCLREMDRAQELDPTSHAILADKGLMLFHAGQPRQGLELLKQVERSDPEFLSPHRYLAEVYMSLRDYPDFLVESEKAAELSHDDVLKNITAAAKGGFDRNGERGLFQELYRTQKKYYKEGKLPATLLAVTCARMGKKDEAMQLLHEEYEKHNSAFLKIRDNADLLTLQSDARYQDLISTIRYPSPGTTTDARFDGPDATDAPIGQKR